MEPAGAPTPLLKQVYTESKFSESSFGEVAEATETFHNLAPSKWQATSFFAQMAIS